MYTYTTSGVCAKSISFDIEDDRIVHIDFDAGCPGNLMGIKALVEGQKIDDIIQKFSGITCGSKATSCPDQLAKALAEHLEEFKK